MFGVEVPFRGEDQTIDITDDRTGETHICAQEHIPMYVNEVGHNKELVQNILPREVTGKEVHYFLHLKEPLCEGQEGKFLTTHTDCVWLWEKEMSFAHITCIPYFSLTWFLMNDNFDADGR